MLFRETLSQSDFDARLADDELSLTLVGMSNVGKSHWSGRLADEAGFERINIDDAIEQELLIELQNAGYTGGIADVAKWMGQPYEQRSPANQRKYLDLEAMKMRETIDELANPPLGRNVVVDTTGSVVHIDRKIRRDLKRHSTVVYLQATDDMQREMFKKYMENPKPVIWGKVFRQKRNETSEEALARSYPKLLEHRSRLYKRMAHVVVPHQVSLDIASPDDFLTYVRDELPKGYLRSASYKPSR